MTTNHPIVFDIETGPLPDSEILPFMPTEWPLGNVKDPEKIKAAIEAKKKAWIADAALEPMTGQVLAIGLLINEAFVLISEPQTEAMMLHEFWDSIQGSGSIHQIIGFCSNTFDLPFLVKRSWHHDVEVPQALFSGNPRYPWSKQAVDLHEYWQLGDRQASGSLDTVSKHLRIGAKTGNGADFSGLWATNRESAVAYLKNDLELTAKMAKKFKLI